MHLHDRRGYALAPGFQEHAMKLMDRLDDSAVSSGRIDTVVNDGGILTGFFVDEEGSGEEEIFEKRLELWKTVKK